MFAKILSLLDGYTTLNSFNDTQHLVIGVKAI
jgi:hypothetical protein